MSKHVHVSNTLIIDNEGHYVASTTNCYESEQTNAANARRIAACLNACAGINPEAVPDVVAALKAWDDPNMTMPRWLKIRKAALAKLEVTK